MADKKSEIETTAVAEETEKKDVTVVKPAVAETKKKEVAVETAETATAVVEKAEPVKEKETAEATGAVEAEPTAEKEVEKVGEGAAATKRKKRSRKVKKRGVIDTKAKKKRAVARAVIKKGSGKIKINKRSLRQIEPYQVNEFIREPLKLAGGLPETVDISVNVKGGGFMAQAVSARSAIARALVEFSNDQKLKERFLKYDRMLLVDDSRRVEPKKPLGKKARKKKQSSKR